MRLIPRPSAATSADVEAPPAEPTPAQQAERIADRIRDAMPQPDLWALPMAVRDEVFLVAHNREEVRIPARDAVRAAARYAVARLARPETLAFGASGGDHEGERRWYFDSEAGPLRVRRAPQLPAGLPSLRSGSSAESPVEREDAAA